MSMHGVSQYIDVVNIIIILTYMSVSTIKLYVFGIPSILKIPIYDSFTPIMNLWLLIESGKEKHRKLLNDNISYYTCYKYLFTLVLAIIL